MRRSQAEGCDVFRSVEEISTEECITPVLACFSLLALKEGPLMRFSGCGQKKRVDVLIHTRLQPGGRSVKEKAKPLVSRPILGAAHLTRGVCRKNEFLCAHSVMLCVSVVKLPEKTFTTEAGSLHREPRRTFSDRLLKPGVNETGMIRKNSVAFCVRMTFWAKPGLAVATVYLHPTFSHRERALY